MRRLKKRPTRKWSKLLWIIPFFLIFFFLFLFFKSGIFTIKQVVVAAKSLGCASEKGIKDSAELTGQNFFLANTKAAEEAIKLKFYCIKAAPIKRSFPDKMRIEVLSRQPAAFLVALETKEASISSFIDIATPSALPVKSSFQIDEEGMVFSKDPAGADIPRVYIFNADITLGKKMSGDLIPGTLRVLTKLKEIRFPVKESLVFDKLYIVTSDSPKLKIIFRLNEDLDTQLASLQVILDKAKIDLKELEFIDLRFDKPIVRFAPKKVL